MTRFTLPLQFRHGAALSDGQPVFFNSSDYPYYRDDARNWEQRLSQLKNMGVKVVSCYIP